MKIALIGPGIMSIPPSGWGGVEALIWNHYNELIKRGIEVDIFNTKDLFSVVNHINQTHYDFIHLHYDVFTEFFNKYLNKPYCLTSHWGAVKEYDQWSSDWNSIFSNMLQCKGLISLSSEITSIYKEKGYKNFVTELPVGTDVNKFNFNSTGGNGKAICVGKIEPRKMQTELSIILNNRHPIDFFGPIQDERFKNLDTSKHLGSLTREQVYSSITNYSCFVLASKGEASAQVIPEALAAGLSICITETSASNLDLNLPFIKIIPPNWIYDPNRMTDIIKNLCEENKNYREDIRKYALDTFDTCVIIDKYLNIVKNFKEYTT